MITYTTSNTDKDLLDILALQQQNLPANLTKDEAQSEGFVTVNHSFEEIKKLHGYEPHLLIKDDDLLVGYLLAMTKNSRLDIRVLRPMFEIFDKIFYKQKLLSAFNYLVVGQVCIAKDYRGLGLLDKSYAAYKQHFQRKYDLAITEIAVSNQRSINAHTRTGFSEIHRYTDAEDVTWSVVIWEW